MWLLGSDVWPDFASRLETSAAPPTRERPGRCPGKAEAGKVPQEAPARVGAG